MRRRRRISMNTEVQTKERDAILVEDAAWIRVMGQPVLEALPSARAPYAQVDPFILVHEARGRLSPDFANTATKHLHRGFDNVLYMLEGSLSTGHSTGPGGAMERARLREGSLLVLRTGRGVWHADALGADEIQQGLAGTEFRIVLFWVPVRRSQSEMLPRALATC